MMGQPKAPARMESTQVFAENPWLRSMPGTEAQALLDASTPVKLGSGQFVYRQGDAGSGPSGGFFGVVTGLIKLSILHPDGNEAILTIIEPGTWFGEGSLLDRRPRAHTAVALEASQLQRVSAESFDILMQRNAFAQATARLVAGQLRMAYCLMADSGLQSTRERIGRRLAMLAHGDVTQSESARRIVSTSQDVLAMMLGISRPTLNKELQVLAKQGAITLRYGRIQINDLQLLQGEGQGR
jgi:CRP-like cAMP-binding protein